MDIKQFRIQSKITIVKINEKIIQIHAFGIITTSLEEVFYII